ncbi:MAG: hypothetical protein LBP26_06440 [Clostridiales bacterium]|jgi:signal transduction histidine kinase|nr:hypothetical protein [Clostridiales bacterium]
MKNLFAAVLRAVSGEDITRSLGILWKGMLAIAIVLTVVFAATLIMNAVSRRIADKKSKVDDRPDAPENPENV